MKIKISDEWIATAERPSPLDHVDVPPTGMPRPCGKQWGGGDVIHSCALPAGHAAEQCDWPGSMTWAGDA